MTKKPYEVAISWFPQLPNLIFIVIESQEMFYGIVFDISIHAFVVSHIPTHNANNLKQFFTYSKSIKWRLEVR